MSADATKLDDSLLWESDGHLSDLAINAIVDAESALLPAAACEHAERCEPCARRIGELALLACDIDLALKPATNPAPLAQPAAREPLGGLPLAEISLALLLALLGKLPTLQHWNPAGLRQSLRAATHLSVQVLQHIASTSWGAALPWAAAVLLLAASSGIALAARSRVARSLGTRFDHRL